MESNCQIWSCSLFHKILLLQSDNIFGVIDLHLISCNTIQFVICLHVVGAKIYGETAYVKLLLTIVVFTLFHVIEQLPISSLLVQDHVLRTFSTRAIEIVSLHCNGYSSNDISLSISILPLPEAHQLGLIVFELGLHFSSCWRLY